MVERIYHDASGAAQAGPVQGSLVTVTVSFQSLHIGLPFLPVPDGGRVEESATARIEAVPGVRLACGSSGDVVAGGSA